jgi:histidinol-phosphate aminotransferase
MSKPAKVPSWLPLNKRLVELTPYGAPQIEGVLHLNTNENPFPLPKKIVKAMLKALERELVNLNRYPDRDALKLRSSLAKYLNHEFDGALTENQIWVANGSNEIIQSLMLACGDRGAIGFLPSYSMHPLIAKSIGIKWIDGKRNPDFSLNLKKSLSQIKDKAPGLVFLTTPNNPTGSAISLSEIEEFAKVTKKTKSLLVIDEAYEEFSNIPTALNLLEAYPHLVVIRTMSKAFAFAGARVGYLAANSEVIDGLLRVRLPYHLSTQTQAIAQIAIDNAEVLLSEVRQLAYERDRVVVGLQELGITVAPSDANFLLFSNFGESNQKLFAALLERKILVRDVGIAGHLRVTIGTPIENDLFLSTMKDLLKNSNRE